ncbi:hypothetical protein PLICRDRAFT_659334 [Plicaturopsis crispa FD-325 SS-3]|nr:hypothetical protein PLICRDRAFT_659334 [Plicaturopsis crispa FD-325 SS-3]
MNMNNVAPNPKGAHCQSCGLDIQVDYSAPIPVAPLPALFTTNKVPTQTEVAIVRAVVPIIDLELDQVNADIDQLRGVLETMDYLITDACRKDAWTALNLAFVRREALRESRHQHVEIGSSSLIRHFPSELLSEIFLLNTALESIPSIGSFAGQRPLRLGQVCRQWREVALSTSRLWSNIVISSRPGSVDRYQALISLWIERSGLQPLSLTVRGRPDDRNIPLPPLFQPLVTHSHRWKSLTCVPSVEGLDDVLGQLPNLKALRFLSVFEEPANDEARALTVSRTTVPFQILPRLEQLRIPSMYLVPEAVFPWDKITRLTVDFAGAPNLQFLLLHLPSLIHCTLCQTTPTSGSHLRDVLPAPNPHAKLESLELRLLGDGIFFLFPVLQLPSLKALSIQSTDPRIPDDDVTSWRRPRHPPPIWNRSMVTFLHPSTRSILNLAMQLDYANATVDAVSCLQDAPSVVELGLATFDTKLFERLTRRSDLDAEPDVAPNLRRLTVDPRISNHWNKVYSVSDYGSFVAMLYSRIPVDGLPTQGGADTIGLLDYLELHVYTPPPAETIADLKRLRGFGVRVILTCKGNDLLADEHF